jgi:hypothetical protein
MEHTKEDFTEAGWLLLKKYAAKCDINWDNLTTTAFQEPLEKRAESQGHEKITEEEVRWYFLEKHNSDIAKLLEAKITTKEAAENCMTTVKDGEVFHKGEFVEKLGGK